MKLLNNDINREYLVGDVIEVNNEVYLVVACPIEQDADDGRIGYKYGLVSLTYNVIAMGDSGKVLFNSLSDLTSEFKEANDHLLTGKLVFTPDYEEE